MGVDTYPLNTNILRYMWIFYRKTNFDGSFTRYKAHLVSDGKAKKVDANCCETFSLIVNSTTIRDILSLALSRACLSISWMLKMLICMVI